MAACVIRNPSATVKRTRRVARGVWLCYETLRAADAMPAQPSHNYHEHSRFLLQEALGLRVALWFIGEARFHLLSSSYSLRLH